uniref:Secreted protein n=1 Tax=Opuntia streptacantha TaxID=393608 RepID=A0A7C9DQH9_OPUST
MSISNSCNFWVVSFIASSICPSSAVNFSIWICCSSFSAANDLASEATRPASLKFLAAAATFFSASSSATLLSMKSILCFRAAFCCWMLDFLEASSCKEALATNISCLRF